MNRIKQCIDHLLSLEKSPQKLAMSCCLGIFIGTSSLLGIQTWVAIFLSWLFGVNALLVLAVLYIVNNPFTMAPIIVADYAIGHWIIERWMGVDLVAYNPSWMYWIDDKIGSIIYQYLGITTLCFWCYIFGGILFALLCSVPLYPFLKFFFARKIKG